MEDGNLREASHDEKWMTNITSMEDRVHELQRSEKPVVDAVAPLHGPVDVFSLPFEELRRKVLFEEASRKAVSLESSLSLTGPSLFHYGVEIRHVPLGKHLANAPKYVSSRAWTLAREECKFSRCFDRTMELVQTNAWPFSTDTERPEYPAKPHGLWDDLLEEVWFMARDFDVERVWRGKMAKILAEEARRFRVFVFGKRKPVLLNRSLCYRPSMDAFAEFSEKVSAPGTGLTTSTTEFYSQLDKPMRFKILDEIPELGQDENTLEERPNRKPVDWSSAENALLSSLYRSMAGNSFKAIAEILNLLYHNSRSVRRDSDVFVRLQKITTLDTHTRHRVKYHLERINLMNSSATRLITPRPSMLPKKLNMVAHPSHEAAARKANQNISKLLTPQELAMRRIQRTRIMTDPSGAIMVAIVLRLADPV